MNLTGNTIFITGGGSGIGRALAEALHKRGNKVIISGRRKGHLDAVVKANPGIEAIELDIADPHSIEAVAKKLIAEHPDLNVLINNAGIMEPDQAAGIIDDGLARVDRYNQFPRCHPVNIGSSESAEKPSWSNSLQHVGTCVRAIGCDCCLFCY
jgi:NAD(P)-dependent dehydrogenase (short-subunit alcohol dehydrogenase family)